MLQTRAVTAWGWRMVRPKWAHPEAIEREYQREIERVAKQCRVEINKQVMPEVSALHEMATRYRPDSIGDDGDQGTWIDRLNRLLNSVLSVTLGSSAFRAFTGSTANFDGVDVRRFAERIKDFNLRQARKLTRARYGEAYNRAEPWLDDLMRAWELENLKLIRSIPEQYVDNLQGTIIRAINEGQNVTQLKETIRATYDQPVNRAQLIANDQVGKLNANLTEYRQKSVGIAEYTWRTVMDGRERPEHGRRNGETFSWKRPPSDGHPGMAVRCRCFAEPKWPSRDEVTLT